MRKSVMSHTGDMNSLQREREGERRGKRGRKIDGWFVKGKRKRNAESERERESESKKTRRKPSNKDKRGNRKKKKRNN